MTSEKLNDIRMQPQATCPMIDTIQKTLKNVSHSLACAQRDLKRKDYLVDVEKSLTDIESEMFSWTGSLDSQLEDIRKNVEDIRSWGQEWKDLALQLLEEKEN